MSAAGPEPDDGFVDRFNLSAWALRHRPLTLFFFLLIAIGGTLAYFQLGQREDPDFTIRYMVIRTLWPGTSAEQVDREVTDRLESKLLETPYFFITTSYSKRGESLIVLQIKESAPAAVVPDIFYQVRKHIGDIRATLPPEIVGPFFNDEFGAVYGSIYAFTTDGFSQSELRDYVETVRQRLISLPNVAKIELVGVRPDKIFIEVSNVKLAQSGLGIADIANALQAQNAVQSAGRIDTTQFSLPVRVNGAFTSLAAIAATPLRAKGGSIRLGDIAQVYRGYADPPEQIMRYRGKPAIGLAVSMTKDGDVLKLGADLRRSMEAIKAELPLGIEFAQVSDQPYVVKQSVAEFMTALGEAVAIVLLVSFVALRLRAGLVVAVTIPFVLAATFLLMLYFKIDLHRISTGALIIALGLLVDDAMIAVEMMARKLEEGYDKFAAATFAFKSTAMPMLTGTLITVMGFLPIATAKSATGEYTFAIFAVVALALLASWVAAVIITPFLGYSFLKEHKGTHSDSDVFDSPFYRRFRALLDACILHRKRVLVVTGVAFVLGIVGMGLTEKQFFPSSNRIELMVELWLPEGASLAATTTQTERLEALLAKNPDIATYVSYVGNGSPRFFLSMDQKLFRTNFSQTIVLTKDLPARERVVKALRQVLANDFPGIRGRVERVPLGPPVNYPVQFRITGPNIQKLKLIADQVATVMRQDPHALDVNVDWGERVPALQVQVDADKSQALGVSSQSIAQNLNAMLSGATVGQYRDKDRLIDIDVRALAAERSDPSALGAINIPTASGQYVPLSQVGKITQVFEEPIIWRRSRELTITARCDIVDGVQAPDVSMDINPHLDSIRAKLPPGYRIDVGGAWEENAKAQASINTGYPLMIALTLLLLMLQLQRFALMFMVALTAPLGIVGVALALLIFHQPFGFVALLGTIALSGMIMRNSVILIAQIQHDIRAGAPPWIAIRESAVRRLRPILLTAAAAILAMIPLTQSVLWAPMAFAIMGGLFVATVQTLLFVPALYAAWYRVKPPTS
ncbi:MAG: efflux RND transporter permease subunit [Gammaproteobacteria bacterium]